MSQRIVPSPIGPLHAVAEDGALVRMEFAREGTTTPHEADPVLDLLEVELASYFAGALTSFTVPIRLIGEGFELRDWELLREIPYGAMWTYGDMAKKLGDPGAARAVGRANNQNPITIIVPCHRVVGANGAMIGYGGGLDKKRFLLNLEAATLGRSPLPPSLKEGEDQGSFF